GDSLPIKVFGTDLSEEAIRAARLGTYSESALTDVSPERLSRFFEPVERGYRVGRRIRDVCVFVKHDLTRDPPFAKIDLISCRNVLIYFGAVLQKRVFPLFHYCLEPGGFLLLGQAEAIPVGGLFQTVDKGHKLFAKVGSSRSL